MGNIKQPDKAELQRIIRTTLSEDIGKGDITSELLIPLETMAQLDFVSRETLVSCGIFIPELVYAELGGEYTITTHVQEGQKIPSDTVMVTVLGNARKLLAGERVALNLMQRMCGVANLTERFVEQIKGTKAKILDTRKTMPGLRVIDKYSVLVGGGTNHRVRLDDMVLIKDNHIAIAGSVAGAISKAKSYLEARTYSAERIMVVVECDTLDQVKEAIAAKPDRILLDNMTNEELVEAVKLVDGALPLEASGGVNIAAVFDIAETGVDYISVGAITHSAIAADIGADIVIR